MRIFILHNKTKAGSYADIMFHLLIEFLADQAFEVKEFNGINEAKEARINSEKSAVILHSGKKKVSFFSKLTLRTVVKKESFHNFIQVTDSKPVSLGLPQLIISNDIRNFIAQQHSSPVFFGICSNVEKQTLAELAPIDTDYIKVIPITADDEYEPITWSEQQAIKMQYMQGREYFVTFAANKTLQSFTELLKAFSSFKKWQHSSMKLVVTGQLSFTETEEWKEKISTYKFREDVVLLNSITYDDIIKTVAGAYAFIHLPYADNDVLPLLQSIKCETPCLSFNTAVIEEYVTDAAICIEPNNYDQLAKKMILIYKDEALRSRLIAKGKEVSALYTKDKVFTALAEALSLLLH